MLVMGALVVMVVVVVVFVVMVLVLLVWLWCANGCGDGRLGSVNLTLHDG